MFTNPSIDKYLDLDMSHCITLKKDQNPGEIALGEISGDSEKVWPYGEGSDLNNERFRFLG